MSALYTVEFSQTFDKTLEEVVYHLSKYTDELQVLDRIDAVIDHFTTHVEQDPYMYSVCRQSFSLGINKYREYNRNELRLIYIYIC